MKDERGLSRRRGKRREERIVTNTRGTKEKNERKESRKRKRLNGRGLMLPGGNIIIRIFKKKLCEKRR